MGTVAFRKFYTELEMAEFLRKEGYTVITPFKFFEKLGYKSKKEIKEELLLSDSAFNTYLAYKDEEEEYRLKDNLVNIIYRRKEELESFRSRGMTPVSGYHDYGIYFWYLNYHSDPKFRDYSMSGFLVRSVFDYKISKYLDKLIYGKE